MQAQIPVLVLHGRHDILAMPCFGSSSPTGQHTARIAPRVCLLAALRRCNFTQPASWTWQHCSCLTQPA